MALKQTKHLLIFLLGLFCLTSCSKKKEEHVIWNHIWQNSDPSYDNFRIPALIVTQKGTVLAFAEGRAGDGDSGNIDLLIKRSTDNGKTWSEQAVVWSDGE
jgi:sialidase-1